MTKTKTRAKKAKRKSSVPSAPSRVAILRDIYNCFQQMVGWVGLSPGRYAASSNNAKSLIELLEVHDCGSVGGFDPDMPKDYLDHSGDWGPLWRRFLWLVDKHKTGKQLKNAYGLDLLGMEVCLWKLQHIRDEPHGFRPSPVDVSYIQDLASARTTTMKVYVFDEGDGEDLVTIHLSEKTVAEMLRVMKSTRKPKADKKATICFNGKLIEVKGP